MPEEGHLQQHQQQPQQEEAQQHERQLQEQQHEYQLQEQHHQHQHHPHHQQQQSQQQKHNHRQQQRWQRFPCLQSRNVQCCVVMAVLITVLSVVLFFKGGGKCCSSSSSSSSSASTITSATGTTVSTIISKEKGMKTIGTAKAKSANGDTAQTPSFVLEKEEETTPSPGIPPMDTLAGTPALGPSFQQILEDTAALTAGKSAAWTQGEKAGEAGHLMITTTKEEEGNKRVCFVGNAVELREAITYESCSLIQLAALSDGVGEEEQEQDDDDYWPKFPVDGEEEEDSEEGAYKLYKEIVIRRKVVIQGDAVMMPLIDCSASVRAFRVEAGGSLTMRFLRLNQGKGIFRPRSALEGALNDDEQGDSGNGTSKGSYGNMVLEVRGGSILFEPGAEGGSFVGIYFVGEEPSAASVEKAINQSLGRVSIRVYGGRIFMAGGRISFTGCLFFDIELLSPITDRIRFGDDIFMLRGEAYFTGCLWIYTTFIGLDIGLGLNFSIWGGLVVIQFSTIILNNLASLTAVAGQIFFQSSGCLVLTGVEVMFNSAMELFAGMGGLALGAGAVIMTAVAVQDVYAILAAFGVGLDIALGAGVMIATHVAANQFMGILFSGLLGGFMFNGAGVFVGHLSPFVIFAALGTETGAGGFVYNVGITSFHWCPVIMMCGIFGTFMYGTFVSVPAGFLVWLWSPFVCMSGIEVFYGIGGCMFVGAGAAVMGRSPLIELIPIVNLHVDFWIMGSCEPFVEAWIRGPIKFYAPLQGCELREEPPEGDERGRSLEQTQGSLPVGASPTARAAFTSSNTSDITKPISQSSTITSLLAFGLSPHVGQRRSHTEAKEAQKIEDNKVLQAVLSPKLLKLTYLMKGALSRIRVVSNPSESRSVSTYRDKAGLLQPHPVSMRIQDTPDFCGVCGVDILEGKGSDVCAYQQNCDPAFVSSIQAAALYDDSASAVIPSAAPPSPIPVTPSSLPVIPSSLLQATPSPVSVRRIARAIQSVENDELPSAASPPAEARFIVLASLDIVALAINDPLALSTLKDAISFSLGDDVDDPYHQVSGQDAVQVEVFSSGIDEMFAHMYPNELGKEGGHVFKERRRVRRLIGEGETLKEVEDMEVVDEEVVLQLRRYTVILTSTSKLKVRRTLRALGVQNPAQEVSRHLKMDVGEDEDIILTTDMASDVVTYLRAHGTGSSVDSASMGFERTLYIPASDTTAFANNDFLTPALGDYSMRLFDPTMPAIPLSNVGYKIAYELILENFPSNVRVQVIALRASRGDDHNDRSLPWRFTLASTTTDKDGTALVSVKFWSTVAFPPGDYEIQARVTETGAFGLSPLYTLSREGHRRKLYGTNIWL
ncbi:pectin lyase fold virulence factor [Nannochloropsis oceanica]